MDEDAENYIGKFLKELKKVEKGEAPESSSTFSGKNQVILLSEIKSFGSRKRIVVFDF